MESEISNANEIKENTEEIQISKTQSFEQLTEVPIMKTNENIKQITSTQTSEIIQPIT